MIRMLRNAVVDGTHMPIGAVVDTDEETARRLVLMGKAEMAEQIPLALDEAGGLETATMPTVETATVPKKRTRAKAGK